MSLRLDVLKGGATRRVSGSSLLAISLAGCVANSSNPSVMIRSARSDDAQAVFELDLFNPGGRNLRVTHLDYEVSHGESAFPVASGSWTGDIALPAHGHGTLMLSTRFDTPPIEPDSQLLHLSGEFSFVDKTGYLGLKSMDLTKSPFRLNVDSQRISP